MLTTAPERKGGGDEGDRTGNPPLGGAPSEDRNRGQLLLRRAGCDPARSARAPGGNRVVRVANEARTDPPHEPSSLPPQRPVRGGVRLPGALQPERAAR